MYDPALWGAGNGPGHYVIVLMVYAALFVVIRAIHPRVDPEFRTAFGALAIGWFLATFIINYLLFRAGVMSFMPWINNFLHTFVWIGFCLTFLYAGVHKRPFLEQFALFAIFSFIVKWAEHTVLGTWELDHFFFIPGNIAYISGWSLADGLYAPISLAGLKLVSRWVPGVKPAIATA
jgi:hypothetical protein